MCLSESGEVITDRPSALHNVPARFLTPDSSADVFTTDTYGHAVTAFMVALSEGSASALARVPDSDETHRVEIFDARATHDTVVVVRYPVDEDSPQDTSPPVQLPVRRVTSRMNASGRTEWVDDDITRLLGYTSDEYVGGMSLDRLHPDDHQRAILSFAELLGRPGGQTRIRNRVRHADGHWLWFEITHTNLLHTDDPHVFAESFDVSAEMEVQTTLQHQEALLQTLTDALPVGVLHLDAEGNAGTANPTWSALTGDPNPHSAESFTGLLQRPAPVVAAMDAARLRGTAGDLAVSFADPAAECKHAELRIRCLPADEAPFSLVLTLSDTTQAVSFQDQLRDQARSDHLTRVLNRFGIEDELAPILEGLTKQSLPLTLLYLDLNNFKTINDTFGHAVGDEVLVTTAELISSQIRQTDLVGRIGGDEFVAVLLDATPDEASHMVGRIKRQLAASSRKFDTPTEVTVSVGMALAKPNDTFNSLVHRADQAMYRNKANESPPGH